MFWDNGIGDVTDSMGYRSGFGPARGLNQGLGELLPGDAYDDELSGAAVNAGVSFGEGGASVNAGGNVSLVWALGALGLAYFVFWKKP